MFTSDTQLIIPIIFLAAGKKPQGNILISYKDIKQILR